MHLPQSSFCMCVCEKKNKYSEKFLVDPRMTKFGNLYNIRQIKPVLPWLTAAMLFPICTINLWKCAFGLQQPQESMLDLSCLTLLAANCCMLDDWSDDCIQKSLDMHKMALSNHFLQYTTGGMFFPTPSHQKCTCYCSCTLKTKPSFF